VRVLGRQKEAQNNALHNDWLWADQVDPTVAAQDPAVFLFLLFYERLVLIMILLLVFYCCVCFCMARVSLIYQVVFMFGDTFGKYLQSHAATWPHGDIDQ
jgi:hypothetical protein